MALLAGAMVYFAPTLLAVARHRGAAPLTFSLNLFLGWTGVGWVVAWFLAIADRRLRIWVTSVPPTPGLAPLSPVQPPSITVAPDGRHWWDGCTWRDGWQVAPLGALWSPDAAHWFTGTQWISSGATVAPPAGSSEHPSTSPYCFPDEPEWWRRGPRSGKGSPTE